MSVKLAFKSRLDEEKTLGIIKKIENGLRIPPVKYKSKVNWNMSINKKKNEFLLDSWGFLNL